MSLGAVVFCILLTLKLLHDTALSWWVVFAPLAGEVVIDSLIILMVAALGVSVHREARRRLRGPQPRTMPDRRPL